MNAGTRKTTRKAATALCLAALGAASLLRSASANTATVAAELSQDGTAFTATFAGHANETNSLWVVYGASDMGEGTNGWAHVERLGTVMPETNFWTYAAPAGWGDTMKAIRFVLSEVPYDYDYSLDFIRNANYKQRIVLSDFDLYMNYRVCAKIETVSYTDGSPCVFCNRDTEGNVTPYFNLFAIKGSQWRFDYNDKTGASQGSVSTSGGEYAIEASSAGLYVNGSLVNSKKGTTSSTASNGRLEFFCGNTSASSMANMNLAFNLYGAQIYDAPTGGNLLVNLVPMVKDGVAGMFDTVRGKCYYSDIVINGTAYPFPLACSTRVESANPFFASALVAVVDEGPTVFTPASATTDAADYDNEDGGILNGTATLTLSGANDWGGQFTVSNGTLVAAFGQGLAATDNLVLAPIAPLSGNYGGYGGWNGSATAGLGSGAGQMSVAGTILYYAWCAPDGGTLAVNVGGEGEAIALSSTYRRFLLNGASGSGTLTFENPVTIPAGQTMIVRTGFGTAVFSGNVTSATTDATGGSVETYNLDNPSVADDGETVFTGTANRFKTLQVRSGTCVMGDGSATTLDGNIRVVNGARFVATNATVTLSGNAKTGGYACDVKVLNGTAEIRGGQITASQFVVGAEDQDAETSAATIAGRLTLDGSLGTGTFGALIVHGSAMSDALTIDDGAEISAGNFNFYRRNAKHNGGTLALSGNYGVNDMGKAGTSRYTLSGGTLTASRVGQFDPTGTDTVPVAYFVFNGGTLVTPSNVKTPFFQNFSGDSAVQMTASGGGTFQVDYATSVTNPIVHAYGSWAYAAADWLTAPAFTKTGPATLTLSGTSSYRCATDVAQGTLALASGDAPGVLPETGVLRLTGGALDLGGNAQTVKGLVGTAGAAVNGSLAVTDGIYPGGAGAVGSFSCGAALSGTLYIDVDPSSGACDFLAVPSGSTLDLSSIDLVLPETLPEGVERLTAVSGATTGTFASVANLPSGWEIAADSRGAKARKISAFVIVFR